MSDSSTSPASVTTKEAPESAWERTVRNAVRSLRYGSVEVQVHDGRVVQVETREKVRFDDRRVRTGHGPERAGEPR